MECRRIREGICLCVGDLFRAVYCGESNVVQNNATILRSVMIKARQDGSTMSETFRGLFTQFAHHPPHRSVSRLVLFWLRSPILQQRRHSKS
jgi:hypothetical protein